MPALANVTDSSFEQDVQKGDGPVLVEFWAEWSGPCQKLLPVLEEIADAYGDELTIVRLDIDNNHETPAKHGVRGIPTLILFKGG